MEYELKVHVRQSICWKNKSNLAAEVEVRDHDSVSYCDVDSLPPIEDVLQNVKLRRNVQVSRLVAPGEYHVV